MHNVKNFMLAAAATLGVCKREACREAITDFSGLAHRSELITEHRGISFINSSIDTCAERTIQTLGALSGDTVVIICGKNKGLKLEGLAKRLPDLTVGAVLMGEVGAELSVLLPKEYKYELANGFDDAIKRAAEILGNAGNIILSPAGTSFDKFKSYEQRGNAFRDAVIKYINTQ